MKKLLIFPAVLTAVFNFAQAPSEEAARQAVHRIAELTRENYVLEKKGAEISDSLLAGLDKGYFSSARDWKQLDSILTRRLQEVSKDHHLFTWNNLELVEQLKHEQLEDKNTEGEKETETAAETFFSGQKALARNYGFREIKVLDGNIGYIKLSEINISGESLGRLYAAMDFVKGSRALMIDLRDNGGGGSTLGPVLETYFFKEETDLLEFRSKNGSTELEKTVPWLLEERYLKPLYILINKNTASAAEAFAFALKHRRRATIVGQASAGGAYMNTYFLVNDHLILSVSTSAPFLPGTEQSWEGIGVQPHILLTADQDPIAKVLEVVGANLEKNPAGRQN